MKAKILLVLVFVMFSASTVFALDRNRKVEPVKDEIHLTLTKSLYNQTLLMDEPTKRIVYVSYISGFLDAMQLDVIDPTTAPRFIEECKGLTLGDLQDMMIKFKNENSQWRDVSPAYALTIAVPRLRKGLTAFSGNAEEKAPAK